MNKKVQKQVQEQKARRTARVRAKISGTAERPRLTVARSLRSFSAQLIDDTKSHTLLSVSSKELSDKQKPLEAATSLGKLLAEKAGKAGIKQAVFDRGSYKYHGRVKAFADGAREGGLQI